MALSEEEAGKLREELQEEKEKCAAREQRLKERTRETFQKMKDECNNKVQELNTELQVVKQEAEALKAQEEAKARSLEVKDEALKKEVVRNKALEASLEEARSEAAASGAKSSQEDEAKRCQDLSQAQKEAAELKEKVGSLEAQLAAAEENRKASVNEIVAKAKDRVQELAARNKALEEQQQNLSEHRDVAQREVESLRASLAELEKGASGENQAAAEARAELERLMAQQAEDKQRVEADSRKSLVLSDNVNIALAQAQAAAEREEQAYAQVAELEADAAVTRETISKLEAEAGRLQAAAAENAAAADKAQGDELQRLRAEQEVEAQRAETEASKAQDAIAQLQAEVETHRAAAESAVAAAKSRSDESAQLGASHATEKQRLEAAAAQSGERITQLQADLERQQAAAAAEAAARAAGGDEVQKLQAEHVVNVQRLTGEATQEKKLLQIPGSKMKERSMTTASVRSDVSAIDSDFGLSDAQIEELMRKRGVHQRSMTSATDMCEGADEDFGLSDEQIEALVQKRERSMTSATDRTEARETVSELQAKLETLRVAAEAETAAALKIKADELETLRAAHGEVGASYAAEKQRLDAELAQAAEKVSQLQADLERHQATAAAEAAARASGGDELEKVQEAHVLNVQRLEGEATQARDTVTALQSELEALRATAESEALAAQNARDVELEELRAAHAEETHKVSETTSELQVELQRLRSAADDAASSQSEEVAKAGSAMAQLQEELATLRSAAEGAAAAEKSKSDELAELGVSHAAEKQRLDAEVAQSAERVSQLQADLERHQAAAATEAAARAAGGDELEKLQEAHVLNVQRLEGEATQARDTVTELQSELEALRATAESEALAAQNARDIELEKLRAAHAEETHKVSETTSELQVELQRLRSAADDAASSQSEEAAKAGNTIAQLQEELATLRSAAESAAAAEKSKSDELAELGASHAAEKQRLDAEVAQSAERVTKLQGDLERHQAAAAAEAAARAAGGDELEKLQEAHVLTVQRLEGEARDAVSELQTQLESLRASAEAASAAADKAKGQELEQLRAVHAAEIENHVAATGKAKEATSELEADLERLRAVAEGGSAAEQARADEATKDRESIAQLQAELETCRAAAESAVAAEKEARSHEHDSLRAAHAADMQRLEAEAAQLENVRLVHAEEVRRLETEAAHCRESEAAQGDVISQLKSELDRLKSAAEGQTAAGDDITKMQAAHAEDVQTLKQESERAIELAMASADREDVAKAEIGRLKEQLEQLQAAFAQQAQAEGELDRLQAASVEELQRKQAEIASITHEAESLRRKNELLQNSVHEGQDSTELQAQIAELEASIELATQATAQADADLAAERQKCVELQAQVAAKPVAVTNGELQVQVDIDAADALPACCLHTHDLEARLRIAEQDRDAAIARANSAEGALEERQEHGSRGFSNGADAPIKDNEDDGSPNALKARVRLLESQLARAEGSSAALQDAAARAAEKLQSQAMKERELETRLAAASNAGPQFFNAMKNIGGILPAAAGKCLRGRAGGDPPPPQSSSTVRPPPPPPPPSASV